MAPSSVETYGIPTPEYLRVSDEIPPWIIEGVLPVGGSACLYGEAKRGKSYLALQMAAAVTGDTDTWMGFPVQTTGSALFLQLDTSRILWRSQHCTIVSKRYPLASCYMLDTSMVPWPFDLTNRDHQEYLQAAVQDCSAHVVFIDTVRKLHNGDENKSDVMQEVITTIKALCAPAAVVFIGHARKPNIEAGDTRSEFRGSGFMGGDVDCMIQCRYTSLQLVGRSIPDTTLAVTRTPHLWVLRGADDEFAGLLARVLQDRSLTTGRGKAKELERISHRSHDTCRGAVRRAMASQPGGTHE